MSEYAAGRALKDGIFDTFKRVAYTNASHDVWRQLEIDGWNSKLRTRSPS
jgi:hypothetical protein